MDGGRVPVEALADAGQRPTLLIQPNDFGHLRIGHRLVTSGGAMSVKYLEYRSLGKVVPLHEHHG